MALSDQLWLTIGASSDEDPRRESNTYYGPSPAVGWLEPSPQLTLGREAVDAIWQERHSNLARWVELAATAGGTA